MNEATEILRKELTQVQLRFARQYQSSTTSFIHYQFEGGEESRREAIPIFENVCFILALFRTHLSESIQEGKELLARLFHFQNSEGAFPIYLHEYPQVKKPLSSVQMLFPLFFLWRDYRHVIDKALLARLETALHSLYAYVDRLPNLHYLLQYQKEAIAFALYEGAKPAFPSYLHSSKEWGDALLAGQLTGDSKISCWHAGLAVYVGPLLHELQKEFIPRPTLLDLFMQKEVEGDPILFRASLVQREVEIVEAPVRAVAAIGEREYASVGDEAMQITYIKNFNPSTERLSPGFHLFRLVTKEHTLVCQETSFVVRGESGSQRADFHFTYPQDLAKEEGAHEFNLFLSHAESTPLWIAGSRATTFKLGDDLTFTSGGYLYTLQFTSEGEGRFLGHLAFGNRPSQIAPAAKMHHTAYDLQISLRTLFRQAESTLKFSLAWQKIE